MSAMGLPPVTCAVFLVVFGKQWSSAMYLEFPLHTPSEISSIMYPYNKYSLFTYIITYYHSFYIKVK
jgi:hypothetical protein